MTDSHPKIGFLVSGNGYCAEAVLRARDYGLLPDFEGALLTDRPSRMASIASRLNVEHLPVHRVAGETAESYRNRLSTALIDTDWDRIFLSFDWLLPPPAVERFRGQSINLHMGLLPAFKGRNAIGQMFDAGIERPGITLHQVNEGMDDGAIVVQSCVAGARYPTPDKLGRALFERSVPLAVQLFRWWLAGSLDLASHGGAPFPVAPLTTAHMSDFQDFDRDILKFSTDYCQTVPQNRGQEIPSP